MTRDPRDLDLVMRLLAHRLNRRGLVRGAGVLAGVAGLSGLATGAAAASMADVAEGLTVDVDRMRSNIHATRGVIFAERAMMLLGEELGRDTAHILLEEATRRSVLEGRRLHEVLGEMPEVTRHLDGETLKSLEYPEEYLGSADAFRKRLLSDAGAEARDKDEARDKKE